VQSLGGFIETKAGGTVRVTEEDPTMTLRRKTRFDLFAKAVAASLAISVLAVAAVLWDAVAGMHSFF
jgi:hypothetical protein